jgi:hypothetical protein
MNETNDGMRARPFGSQFTVFVEECVFIQKDHLPFVETEWNDLFVILSRVNFTGRIIVLKS